MSYPLRFDLEFFTSKFNESQFECISLTLAFVLL